MSRTATPINETRIERLRLLMAYEHLNQKQFAKKCSMSEDQISHRLKGKPGISNEDIENIIKNFPKYRSEWLLDEGELPGVPTVEEYNKIKSNEFMNTLQTISDINKLKKEAIKCLLHIKGYEYQSAYVPSDRDIKISKMKNPTKGSESELNREFTEFINKVYAEGYVFKKDNELIHINGDRFRDFIEKICDYAEFELLHSKEVSNLDISSLVIL